MDDGFAVRITIRVYELDSQGHVNGAVYLQYGEHARWECLKAAGITQAAMHAAGVAPVRLEETVRYHRELGAGDEVDISCVFEWGERKTFTVRQEVRLPDGTLAAEVVNVGGVLDLQARKLVPDPAERFRVLATTPGVMGL